MESNYVYIDYVKAFCMKDLKACKKIGKVLLTKLIKNPMCSEKTHKVCTQMLCKLQNMPELYTESTHTTLETVKFILRYYY